MSPGMVGDKAAPAGAFALRKSYGYALGAQSHFGYASTKSANGQGYGGSEFFVAGGGLVWMVHHGLVPGQSGAKGGTKAAAGTANGSGAASAGSGTGGNTGPRRPPPRPRKKKGGKRR